MSNIWFSLNIVLPTFLTLALGYVLRRIGFFDETFLKKGNDFVFRILLPPMLFYNIVTSDPKTCFSLKLTLTGVLGTIALFLLLFLIVPLCTKDDKRRSVIIQALFRSNYLFFAIPTLGLMFGDEGKAVAAVLSTFIIPTFNILAVFTLTFFDRSQKLSWKKLLINLIKHPLLIGCLAGILGLLIGLRLPTFLTSTLSSVTGIATPLALILLGADFTMGGAVRNKKALFIVTFARLVLIPGIFIVISILMGFRGAQYAALLMVFASPTAVTSYTMARNANADYELAGQIVVWSTLLSILSIFLIVYLSKVMCWL